MESEDSSDRQKSKSFVSTYRIRWKVEKMPHLYLFSMFMVLGVLATCVMI